jgi:superkiller protein 3
VPKVIDFGVAKATEQKLTERTLFTQYGTMVGTFEYMSPEQAEMSALGVDTRSDIYSLGVLLYELLTGSTPLTHKRIKEAAYAEILRLIKEEEPPRPSTRLSDSGEALASISAQRHMEPAKLTKLVRGELDWIVMKTLEKDRNRRYETAKDFVADVQRYLNDEPVLACPPSAWYRFRKFGRRNKSALAFTGLVLLILLTVTGGIGWNVRDRAARQTAVEQEVKLALQEAEQWQEQGKWQEALSAAKRAEGVLAGGGSDELRERVHQLRKDLDMVLRLEDIRLLSSEWKDDKFDSEPADQAYAHAFADYGIDVGKLPAEEAAARIRGRPGLAIALAVALDDWARIRSRKDKAGGQTLTALAQSADPDPWRRQMREACEQKDGKALAALAASPDLLRQPPTSLVLLAAALRVRGDVKGAIRVLRPAQRQYPGDFWINLQLAGALGRLAPAHRDEEVSFSRAALAARPQSIAAHNNLGWALSRQGKLDEAIDIYQRAIELDPKFTRARINLGEALQKQGKVDEAIDWCRKTINLDPKSAEAHGTLGNALVERKKMNEAIGEYKKAIELDPKLAVAHYNLGLTLAAQRELPEAIDAYHKAIEINPKYADAYNGLGNALRAQQKLREAVDAYHKAIKFNPRQALAYNGLGNALAAQKKLKEALAAYRKAIDLDPKYAVAHSNLGVVLGKQKRLDEAIRYHRKGVELDPKLAVAHYNLGRALSRKGLLDEAIAEYREAIRLKPDDGEFHCDLAVDLTGKGLLDEAIAEHREAIRLKKDHARAHAALGYALYKKGQLDEAIAEYREALRLKQDWPEVHVNLGSAQMRKGQPDKAIAEYREAIRLKKDDPMPYHGLGNALRRQGKHDDAIAAYRKAIELDPKYAGAHRSLGNALTWQGKYDDAIAAYREAIRLEPNSALGHYYLGRALNAKGDLDGAERAFREAVRLEGNHGVALDELAQILLSRGNLKEAIATARAAVKLGPRSEGAWQALGWAHYRTGDWKASIEALEKSCALQNNPKGGDAGQWFPLAMAHWQLGHKEEACKWYDQAVQWMDKNQPKNEELRRYRAEAAELLGIEKKKD